MPPSQGDTDHDLTWPALLAHWTALAQSSLALPASAEGERWRAAVPALIGLDAITHALGDLDRLAPREDRSVALDLAAVGIEAHGATLTHLWRDEALHPEVATLLADARAVLLARKDGGLEWCVTAERLVVEHPAQLVEALLSGGFRGDLYLPVPGTVLFKTSPAAFAKGTAGAEIDPEERALIVEYLGARDVGVPRRARRFRQVHRQFDFGTGRVVRDLVQQAGSESPGGQPQLLAAILGGKPQPVTLPIPGMDTIRGVGVEFGGSEF